MMMSILPNQESIQKSLRFPFASVSCNSCLLSKITRKHVKLYCNRQIKINIENIYSKYHDSMNNMNDSGRKLISRKFYCIKLSILFNNVIFIDYVWFMKQEIFAATDVKRFNGVNVLMKSPSNMSIEKAANYSELVKSIKRLMEYYFLIIYSIIIFISIRIVQTFLIFFDIFLIFNKYYS